MRDFLVHQSVPVRLDECGRGDFVADQAVVIGVARLAECGLGVGDFERGGFARLIAQEGEAQTFTGEVDGCSQGIDLRLGDLGFPVSGIDLPRNVRCATVRSSCACCRFSAAWRILLRVAPQFQTGMFSVIWAE